MIKISDTSDTIMLVDAASKQPNAEEVVIFYSGPGKSVFTSGSQTFHPTVISLPCPFVFLFFCIFITATALSEIRSQSIHTDIFFYPPDPGLVPSYWREPMLWESERRWKMWSFGFVHGITLLSKDVSGYGRTSRVRELEN
ncbi:hypothetical protein M501DRAFT_993304 [Patellaria atrata CBS 101060]|uniref:Uncharacterized protein n=1 Tax=Patellaria atrata CBS 101060 TaxID=1346257 RepID=A0A9P4SGP7_9PEZI|nr:hypothetical protein M501DRAFT_993304 [Patellaria atrata CBS 101060]